MEVFAFVGHSGTGKSHHAPVIAARLGIEYIIDDGLLIKGNMNLAGRSSKRENTRYGAIKRALFKDPEQAQQVKEKLAEIKPDRVLVLGTSRRMADYITQNLDLPKPLQYFTIEEVSDPDSIKTALTIREKENRHVIPLPTFAIKKDFPGYLIDPLRTFFSLPPSQNADIPVQRSVVRPIFSRLGSFFITEHVITDLAEYIASRVPGVHKVLDVELENGKSKVVLSIDLSIELGNVATMSIINLLKEVRQRVKEEIEHQTGFYLDEVYVYAKKIHMEDNLSRDPKTLRQLFTS